MNNEQRLLVEDLEEMELVDIADRILTAEKQLEAVRGLPETSCAGHASEYRHGQVDGVNQTIRQIKAIAGDNDE